jgi:hypothetical protein
MNRQHQRRKVAKCGVFKIEIFSEHDAMLDEILLTGLSPYWIARGV